MFRSWARSSLHITATVEYPKHVKILAGFGSVCLGKIISYEYPSNKKGTCRKSSDRNGYELISALKKQAAAAAATFLL